ncbi:leucine rich repeat family [Cryptosporidium sp. chipmunk genotype I]|uniref:leucine rich repeat family n=1 Tax=Cryptosporidium sp. chipmunk genotype I TaxID=1280935 RepID=UPI00351A04E4|nr:leucine rich repeat family [Cryptosporidium sp. chipmunk genotype I]
MTQQIEHYGIIGDGILSGVDIQNLPLKKGKLVTSDIREYSDSYIYKLYLLLKNVGIRITESFLYGISGPNRKELKIPFCNGVKASSFNYFFFNSPNLEIVDLSNCYQVNNRVIKCIISNCRKLRELNICGCKLVTDSAFNTELFSPIGSSMTNLRVLNIQGCSQIIDLQSIIKRTRDLESLNISYCRNITISTLEDVIQCCINLKELDISSCDGINDNNYEFNYSASTNIEKVSLSRSKLSSYTLGKIISSMDNLRYLNLNYCVNVNDEVFDKISSKLMKLNTLCLRSCANISDKSFYYLGENLKELENLDISWCPMLTSKTLKYLALRYSRNNVNRLKTLKLSQNTNLGNFFESDDDFTDMINVYRKKIPRLNLDNRCDFSNDEINPIQTSNSVNSEQNNISEFQANILQDKILEECIAKLIRNANVNTKLVGGGLTPLSMCLLIKYNSETLVDLELEGLKNVTTSDVLEHIGMLCKNLENLSISIFENDDLCIESFNQICRKCKNLNSLSLDISNIESEYHHSTIIDCISNEDSLLKLNELSIVINPKLGISSGNLDSLSSCKFQLTKLKIKNFQGFSNEYIKENNSKFIQLFSNILEISLSGNDYANDDDVILLLKLVKAPNSVELIDFNNISMDLPKYIWENFLSIKRLNVISNKTKVLLERFN